MFKVNWTPSCLLPFWQLKNLQSVGSVFSPGHETRGTERSHCTVFLLVPGSFLTVLISATESAFERNLRNRQKIGVPLINNIFYLL